MPTKIDTTIIDTIKDQCISLINQYARRLRHLHYCDLRVEVTEGKGAVAENGNEKASAEDYSFLIAIRAISGNTLKAAGYFGQILGTSDLENLNAVLKEGLRHAHRRALVNAENKAAARDRFGPLGESLTNLELAPIQVRQATLPARYRINPRSVPLAQVVDYVKNLSKAVQGLGPIHYNVAGAETSYNRELFCSSEGALIDHSFALTEGFFFVVAQGGERPLELYDFVGHLQGWEVITEGVNTGHQVSPDFHTFAVNLAKDTLETAKAPPLRPPDQEVTVVTDPHFNALVVHEVVGHPTELDRALKFETSYAGRSWLFKSLKENQIGKQIASPLVSAFSDPTIEGFGHYLYDHEGTPAKRVDIIDKGVFKNFMNSRQTAAILGVEPNGSYKASGGLVPLIRMSNTVFAPGDRDPQEIIKEVDHGYYVVGHRIPSVAESRENFRISAMKVYEIRNGELGQLYRDGGIMADSRDYFMSIDAVGRDFHIFPIPN